MANSTWEESHKILYNLPTKSHFCQPQTNWQSWEWSWNKVRKSERKLMKPASSSSLTASHTIVKLIAFMNEDSSCFSRTNEAHRVSFFVEKPASFSMVHDMTWVLCLIDLVQLKLRTFIWSENPYTQDQPMVNVTRRSESIKNKSPITFS